MPAAGAGLKGEAMTTIALFGAGGKMGLRLTRSIKDDGDYRLYYVEPSAEGQARLLELGVEVTAPEEAAQAAEVVILAVPDTLIARVAEGIIGRLKPGAMVMTLDPAAAHAGRLPQRRDVSYFVTHPTHPPLYDLLAEESPEARRDFWGGGIAKQALVCALHSGPEEDYETGAAIAARIFQPVSRVHRVTVEQMALLEPAMSESVTLTCLSALRETMDEVIRLGVPAQAARDFMLGHIQIELAILFDALDWQVSAGARQALAEATPLLFRSDWKKVLEPEEILKSVRRITESSAGSPAPS
jgi:hypothetical protein